jgi:ABC-2 type transport system permease protein
LTKGGIFAIGQKKQNMYALLLKEVRSFLSSLVGYVVLFVFIGISSLFLWIFPGENNILDNGYASLGPFFDLAPWIFLFLVPAVTMRMFAEERKTGTIENLLTKPIGYIQVVLAKYFASVILVLCSLLPSLIYLLSVYVMGNPHGNIDMGGTWGSFIGLLCLASIYAAIGLFCSSISDNQIIAFIVAILLCFVFLTGFDYISTLHVFSNIEGQITGLGIASHYKSMSRGVIDLQDLAYFVGVIVIFLYATKFALKLSVSGPHSIRIMEWINFSIIFTSVILIIFIVPFTNIRYDLTSEKRYTLSPVTRQTLKKLDETIIVKVYLEGDMPIGFKRLQTAIHNTLDEFRVIAKDNIQYEFINPSESANEKERNEIYESLAQKGLKPTNIQDRDKEGAVTRKILFSGVLISCNGVEVAVNLLKNNSLFSAEENLNASVEELEYALMSMISNLSNKKPQKIAFIEGQGELSQYEVADISRELANYYQVDRGTLGGRVGCLDAYTVAIIAAPTKPFSEIDKFVIDQYVMNGGKLLWLVDPVYTNTDSLAMGRTLAFINNLNIDDQLFRYGARFNPVLVQDVQCALIPINMGSANGQSRFTPTPWYYYPLLGSTGNNPLTRNINLVKGLFVSTIDTLKNNLKKTCLLNTSGFSRTIKVPALISLREADHQPSQADFNQQNLPTAVLLEGEFQSVFKNRMINQFNLPANYIFHANSKTTRMIVVADGDIICNEVHMTQQGPSIVPLGYDRYSQQTFGNKEFIMNCINYLADREGLLSLRNKTVKLRLLDKEQISQHRLKWQLVNTVSPLLIILLAGVLALFLRKQCYAKQA